MGQNQSSEKTNSRSTTPHRVNRKPSQALRASTPAAVSATRETVQGTTTHTERDLEKQFQSISPDLSKRIERSASRKQKDAVTVPQSSVGRDIPNSLPTRGRQDELYEQDYERPHVPISHHRPPRLPLPIAEVPDSPNLDPIRQNDNDIPIFAADDNLPRKNSMLSVATQDEEDVGEELQPFGQSYGAETIPYTILWNGEAEKVFVTGTFAAWDKKYRLRRTDSGSGRFTTIIKLPQGTHHLKFFVDNQMVTSPDLPTAVDFNNVLVNYIEISKEDMLREERRESIQPRPAPSPRPEEYSGTITPGEDRENEFEEVKPEEMPEGDFRQVMPQALIELELNEDDERYKRAVQIVQDTAGPPSLPLFLSKSILNAAAAQVKDDGSVLPLPNHTVLNHLMTSNVRNGVLATSVTTRYKKKYVTTISFKALPKPSPTEA